ncbi:MAG: hypothetical protein OCD02_03275 [Spirochaetaceae bacterium]
MNIEVCNKVKECLIKSINNSIPEFQLLITPGNRCFDLEIKNTKKELVTLDITLGYQEVFDVIDIYVKKSSKIESYTYLISQENMDQCVAKIIKDFELEELKDS